MKYASMLCLALLITASAYAQQQPQQRSLQQIYANTPLPEEQHDIDLDVGMVSGTDFGTRWHVAYLPLLAPLPGSVPTTTRVVPTAFALLNVPLPGGSPVITRSTAVARELRRINRISHTRTDVVVRTE
jgi:hypothetical protein